uniref:transposase n=1 Tax=Brumimicrobium mesophilum TaxID=392717 RepID=UPI000D143D11|nr:transposase [Brumimicrobium mesophilum]
MKEKFDFEQFSKDLVASVKTGKPLTGHGGVFTPLIKMVLEASLEAEISEHVKETKPAKNRRNGSGRKNMESSLGTFELQTPRDRNGSFEPAAVGKRQVTLSSDIDKKILGLYGLGMSYSDIQSHLKELYDFEISDGTISSITDRIIPEIKEW